MLWPKGIGIDATILGISFLKYVANATKVIDPFCGYGTVLAVANYMSLDAIGNSIYIARISIYFLPDFQVLIFHQSDVKRPSLKLFTKK